MKSLRWICNYLIKFKGLCNHHCTLKTLFEHLQCNMLIDKARRKNYDIVVMTSHKAYLLLYLIHPYFKNVISLYMTKIDVLKLMIYWLHVIMLFQYFSLFFLSLAKAVMNIFIMQCTILYIPTYLCAHNHNWYRPKRMYDIQINTNINVLIRKKLIWLLADIF